MRSENPGTVNRLIGYMKPYGVRLAFSFIFAIINAVSTLYAPILTGRAVDLIADTGRVDFDGLKPVIIRLALVAAIAAVSQYLMNLCTNRLAFSTVRDLRNDAFENLNRLPLRYVDSHPKGDVISRLISDIEQISDGLILGFSQLFTGVVTIVGTLLFMMYINVKIALLVVILTPVSLFAAKFIAKNTFKYFKAQTDSRGDLTEFAEEMAGNQKLVKTFSHEAENEEIFFRKADDLKARSLKAIFFSSLTNPATRFINGLVYTAVTIVGAFSVMNGAFSVGRLSSFLSYANQYTKPFNEISGVFTELQGAFACAARVFELIDEPREKPDPPDAYVIKSADGLLEAKNVCFSYSPDKPLIENFNLSVKPGQRIAIVGPTGCGKTTFINLLMRFYDVNSGEIRLSGHNISECTRDSVRSSYGMVLQDTWLKSGTVRENLSYAAPGASFEEIRRAAEAAYCDGFIRRLENGYDTVISEDGSNLSAGQKQLLCIARAMLSLPPMLILDEATSSIDTRTEILVQKTLAEIMRGRTSFIIAHRLSTIVNADLIIVMNKGHIIEQGTHEELMRSGGFYSELYNSQFSS